MSGFSSDWLSMREAADSAARNLSLLSNLHLPKNGPMRIVDLGAGTGSNLRYLAPKLACAQKWTLVDADSALLRSVTVPETIHTLSVETRRLDLMQDLDALPLEECDLVTASALIDLVSEDWLARLAEKCADAKIPNCLFALSVDGVISWTPFDPADEEIRSLFNAHMSGDKGFGPALGARAPDILQRTFEAAGYRVRSEDSSWRLSSGDSELQLELLMGYANAASEQKPDMAPAIEEWAERRRAHIALGQSELVVGHRDVLARLD
jgi:SAM-dependent methyltransferase